MSFGINTNIRSGSSLRRRTDTISAESSFTSHSSRFTRGAETSATSINSNISRTQAQKPWVTSMPVDAPTPSLCSDHDGTADDAHLPTPPPLSGGEAPLIRTSVRIRGNPSFAGRSRSPVQPPSDPLVTATSRMEETEISEHHRMSDEHEDIPKLPKRPASPTRASVFDKRLPSSPFPIQSPRRPKPPARGHKSGHPAPPTPPKPRREVVSDDEGPVSLSFSSPDSPGAISLPPHSSVRRDSSPCEAALNRSRGRSRSRSVSTSQARTRGRRSTLDQELLNAIFQYGDQHQTEAEGQGHAMDDIDYEDPVLVGRGTRSQRKGFLAHGGAGGEPVFMGVGYVEGAVDEDEEPGVKDQHDQRHVRASAHTSRRAPEAVPRYDDYQHEAGEDEEADDHVHHISRDQHHPEDYTQPPPPPQRPAQPKYSSIGRGRSGIPVPVKRPAPKQRDEEEEELRWSSRMSGQSLRR